MNGIVVKVSSGNTAIVRVERSYVHHIYQKRIVSHAQFMVHDEIGVKVGDHVNVVETAPISKRKRHKIKEKV